MATTQYQARAMSGPAAGPETLRRLAITGVMAAMMMGLVEMLASNAGGTGFWAPLRFIASVFTRGTDTASGFSLGPVVVGLMGHMMIAMSLTMVLALLVWRLGRNPLVLAVAGMTWGALAFVVMWWGILPAIDPAMRLLDGLPFFATHLLFGMVAGLGIAWARRAPAPATAS